MKARTTHTLRARRSGVAAASDRPRRLRTTGLEGRHRGRFAAPSAQQCTGVR